MPFQHYLSFTPIKSKFFASRWWWWFHTEDCCFVCGSYKKHHVSSPVIMLRTLLSFTNHNKEVTRNAHLFFVLFRYQHSRYQWSQKRNMFDTSWILWQLPTEIPTSDAICSTDFLLSLFTTSHIHSIFSSFVDVDGWPLHSSSTISCPSGKGLCHTPEIFSLFCHHTVAATRLVSAGDMWSKTQNLIFVRCSVTNASNCDTISHTLKKQRTAVMPLEVMKQQNYFCNDIMCGANLWNRNFPHVAIPINYTSKFLWIILTNVGNFFEATTYSFH